MFDSDVAVLRGALQSVQDKQKQNASGSRVKPHVLNASELSLHKC